MLEEHHSERRGRVFFSAGSRRPSRIDGSPPIDCPGRPTPTIGYFRLIFCNHRRYRNYADRTEDANC